jgi:hypothetical protein
MAMSVGEVPGRLRAGTADAWAAGAPKKLPVAPAAPPPNGTIAPAAGAEEAAGANAEPPKSEGVEAGGGVPLKLKPPKAGVLAAGGAPPKLKPLGADAAPPKSEGVEDAAAPKSEGVEAVAGAAPPKKPWVAVCGVVAPNREGAADAGVAPNGEGVVEAPNALGAAAAPKAEGLAAPPKLKADDEAAPPNENPVACQDMMRISNGKIRGEGRCM